MQTENVILVAEDNPDDFLLLQRVCQKANVTAHLHLVQNGVETVNYLLGLGDYVDREKFPLPYLVLLDIKMPRMSGLQVLEMIKTDDATRRIPVVVTSASSLQTDIDRAYDLGANAYLVKPIDFEILVTEYQIMTEFFTKHAARPSVGRNY